ncbi:MAG TPA: NAD-dependent epimerase/dehydratase family protein [Candidatus Dormibacteraeota bacterium]|nr:NAD-dependent epimerase/dehydratase family protein [Candidatus Dormibacteraeota bacterium]
MDFRWTGRRVLVTGAGGFVGSALVDELLRRGANVLAIVRDAAGLRLLAILDIANQIDVVRGSITEPGLVQRALNEYDIDSVFHLAAQALVGVANRSPLSTFETNVAGTWHVLEAARLSPLVERVVVASSDKAYGVQAVLPYTESSPLSGLFPYDASKVCTDVLSRCYATSFALPVAVVRCANIYGRGDLNWSRLIPGTIRSALQGEDPVIRSDGTPERDYLYIDDAVAGYLAVAAAVPAHSGESFNLGTARGISVLALVDRILSAVGNPGLQPRILGQAKGEIDRQFLAADKARDVLCWSAKTSLTDGLTATVDWYRTYLSGIGLRELQEVR